MKYDYMLRDITHAARRRADGRRRQPLPARADGASRCAPASSPGRVAAELLAAQKATMYHGDDKQY